MSGTKSWICNTNGTPRLRAIAQAASAPCSGGEIPRTRSGRPAASPPSPAAIPTEVSYAMRRNGARRDGTQNPAAMNRYPLSRLARPEAASVRIRNAPLGIVGEASADRNVMAACGEVLAHLGMERSHAGTVRRVRTGDDQQTDFPPGRNWLGSIESERAGGTHSGSSPGVEFFQATPRREFPHRPIAKLHVKNAARNSAARGRGSSHR